MRTIDKIITKVNCKFGSPMGRDDVNENNPPFSFATKIFDCSVPLDGGGYDKGGAYWGLPSNLRCSYTKDMSYIHFYRK